MRADMLRTFYDYGAWATEKLLDAAAGLTAEQFDAPGHAGHGSIRETLVHMCGAHRGWLSWWDGSLSAMDAYRLKADPADYPDLASVRRLWAEVDAQTCAFTARLTDDMAASKLTFAGPDGSEGGMVLWHMMLHVANHGTQHRSEAAAMLTEHGRSPGDLDMIDYFDQHAASNG